MRGRWSMGVVVAIAVAIAAAVGGLSSAAEHRAASPVRFAVAQHGDGLALSVAFAGVVVTLKV